MTMKIFYNTIKHDMDFQPQQNQKPMSNEQFFKDPRLPFVECRHSKSSVRHFKAHMHKSISIGAVDQGQVQYSVGERQI